MKMNEKQKSIILNIAFSIISIVIVVLAMYLLFRPSAQPQNDRAPEGGDVDWAKQLLAVEETLKKEFSGRKDAASREIEVYKKGDLTGDGISEALIYTTFGGAYTNELVLVMMENGIPVLPKFKQKDGEISVPTFLEGASVRHGEAVDIAIEEDRVIYQIIWSLDETGKAESCEADAFSWNKNTGLFEYDQMISDGIKSQLCESI